MEFKLQFIGQDLSIVGEGSPLPKSVKIEASKNCFHITGGETPPLRTNTSLSSPNLIVPRTVKIFSNIFAFFCKISGFLVSYIVNTL